MKYDPLEAEHSAGIGPELPGYERPAIAAAAVSPKQSLIGWDACPGLPVSDAVFFVVIGMSVIGWGVIARLIYQGRSRTDFIQTALAIVLVPILLGCFVALWKYEQLLAGDIFLHGELASIHYRDAMSGGVWMMIQTLLWSIPSWVLFAMGAQTVDGRSSSKLSEETKEERKRGILN